MAKEKIELSLQDESGQEYVAYPFVESTDVSLSNGMDIETMIAQDVSLPTIVHSETSFKAGVGDSNISNSIVDSSVANMTIKGQTYQNILPEPTLRNAMTDGKTMQKINEGYDNVNVVDGIGKNVVLDGQTLVNGITSFTKYSPTTAGNTKTTVVSTSHYIFDFSQNEAQDKGKVLIYMFGGGFKENAQYTVDYWIYENTMTRTDVDKGNVAKINLNSYNTGFVYVTEGEVGHFTKQITTPSVSTQTGSGYIETFTTCIGKLDIAIVIREGHDLEPLEEHFEGMASVKAPTVTTVGKNLFNPFLHKTLTINSNGTFTLQNADWTKTVKYRLKSNTTYTIKLTNPLTSWVCLKINNTTYSHNLGGSTLEKQFTTDSSGEVEIGVFANTPSNIGHTVATIQLEESPTATTYEPHKSTTLEILGATNLIVDSEANKYYTWDAGIADTSAGTKYCSYRAIVEGLSEVYVKNTHSNYTFWDANMGYISGIPFINGSITTGQPEKDGVIKVPSNAKYLRFAYHTVENRGLPHVGEEIALRSLPNGVCDTINVETGEYVQRIGEVVIDGSETWYASSYISSDCYCGYTRVKNSINTFSANINCDKLPVRDDILSTSANFEGCVFNEWSAGDRANIIVKVAKSKLSSISEVGLKIYFTQNPITVQYELKTPIVKTVDLSSYGNWEKVVLDGSESWGVATAQNQTKTILFQTGNYIPKTPYGFAQGFKTKTSDQLWTDDLEAIAFNTTHSLIQIRILRTIAQTTEELKSYLQQNPITVWCQTATHQDSTNVKEMLSFSNGHVQLSSAEGSLIPSLSYETPTSNSYQLDLAKPSTKYTMKSSSASGSFTIDGTQYNFNTNGTFTTPSTMNNKLMIANGTVTDLMFIEGDVTSKTIPYFKGIKSAFEDEDKIEVLSTGKNLFDVKLHEGINVGEDGVYHFTSAYWNFSEKPKPVTYKVKPNTKYTLVTTSSRGATANWIYVAIDGVGESINVPQTMSKTFTSNSTGFVSLIICANNSDDVGKVTLNSIQLVEGSVATEFEPYKSNTTKIPLLSSLQTVVENVHMTQGSLDNATGAELVDTTCVRSDFIEVVEDTTIVFRNGGLDRMAHILAYDSEKRYVEKLGIVSSCSIPKDRGIKYVRIFMNMNNYDKLKISKSVKAYKGVASLPNGVYDEIVLDRENNKAKIIQRVGKVVLDGSENEGWHGGSSTQNGNRRFGINKFAKPQSSSDKMDSVLCDRYKTESANRTYREVSGVSIDTEGAIYFYDDNITTLSQWKTKLKQNPITVQYELATPIITEIDLEGYPYVYKDGHIFLNADIAPTSEIKYSINQSHMIEASNEDLMRHEKKITNLHKLIGTYVNVEYESTLLALNLELK